MEVMDLVLRIYHNEEMPYEIEYEDAIYTYDNELQDYRCDTGGYLFHHLFGSQVGFLHDNIEIVNFYQKEKITKWGEGAIEELKTKELSIPELQTYITLLMETQNEIIDILGDRNV